MIEKILERLEDKQNYCDKRADLDEYYDGKASAFDEAMRIVQEVAKEYGKDTSNEEFCEWRFEEGTPWVWHCADDKCNSYNSIFKQDLKEVLEQFECKCPYCKKWIKVGGGLHED